MPKFAVTSHVSSVGAFGRLLYEVFILYNSVMNSITSTNARQNWADTVETARTEPVVVTDHGRETVVIMDVALAKLALQVLEDARDVEDATKALERIDAGVDPTFSLAEVAAELGIDRGDRI